MFSTSCNEREQNKRKACPTENAPVWGLCVASEESKRLGFVDVSFSANVVDDGRKILTETTMSDAA